MIWDGPELVAKADRACVPLRAAERGAQSLNPSTSYEPTSPRGSASLVAPSRFLGRCKLGPTVCPDLRLVLQRP